MKSLTNVTCLIAVLLLLYGCEKDDDSKITVTDVEGNVYNTVTIGNQIWMSENLRTTKFTDKTSISNVADSAGWVKLKTAGHYVRCIKN